MDRNSCNREDTKLQSTLLSEDIIVLPMHGEDVGLHLCEEEVYRAPPFLHKTRTSCFFALSNITSTRLHLLPTPATSSPIHVPPTSSASGHISQHLKNEMSRTGKENSLNIEVTNLESTLYLRDLVVPSLPYLDMYTMMAKTSE